MTAARVLSDPLQLDSEILVLRDTCTVASLCLAEQPGLSPSADHKKGTTLSEVSGELLVLIFRTQLQGDPLVKLNHSILGLAWLR